MGTSKPSSGPGANVPLIPPWVPPLPPEEPEEPQAEQPVNGDPEDVSEDGDDPGDEAEPQMAPRGRFAPARRALGDFARSGDTESLKHGLGHYVRKGLGGSPTATRRLAGTANTAGALYNVLHSIAAGKPPAPQLDPAVLRGLSPKTIGDLIIDIIRPTNGTQDTEASRQALESAKSDMLLEFPDADFTALAPPEIDYWVERFLGHDLCNRMWLDVGKAIESKAPSPAMAVQRFEEMRDFVMAKIAACAQELKDRGGRWRTETAARFAAKVIRQTLDIFEDYHR